MAWNEPRIRAQISYKEEKLRYELINSGTTYERKQEIYDELEQLQEQQRILADSINRSTD